MIHIFGHPSFYNIKQTFHNVLKEKATGSNTTAGSRWMKQNLDTGVEVCDNRVKKKQRHTTNKKPKYVFRDI